MQGNGEFKNRMDTAVQLIKKTSIKIDGNTENGITVENAGNNDSSNPMSDQEILDSLMPSANSL